jgi:lysozyme family protein
MADAKIAIEFTLRQEDSTLSGVVTEDAGGRTRLGIAERWHPEIAATGFYTAPVAVALAQAEAIYRDGYWVPMNGDLIVSQYVANRALSFCINEGNRTGVLILQRSLIALGAQIIDDGEPGPATIAALNAQTAANEDMLMREWRQRLTRFYVRKAAVSPAQAKELNGWLNRVKA